MTYRGASLAWNVWGPMMFATLNAAETIAAPET